MYRKELTRLWRIKWKIIGWSNRFQQPIFVKIGAGYTTRIIILLDNVIEFNICSVYRLYILNLKLCNNETQVIDCVINITSVFREHIVRTNISKTKFNRRHLSTCNYFFISSFWTLHHNSVSFGTWTITEFSTYKKLFRNGTIIFNCNLSSKVPQRL